MALVTPYNYNGDGFSDVRWGNLVTSQETVFDSYGGAQRTKHWSYSDNGWPALR
jgi:hypothetical protein